MMKNLIEALNWRANVTNYNGNIVPQETIDRILEAGRLAPSSYGFQAYKLVVIKNQNLKKILRQKAIPQERVIKASHIIVFTYKKSIDTDYINEFFNARAKVQNSDLNAVKKQSESTDGYIKSHYSPETMNIWLSRQPYIALGAMFAAASLEGIDCTGMEGFNQAELDKELNLTDYTSIVVMSLGYRDASDEVSKLKKYRKPMKDFIIEY